MAAADGGQILVQTYAFHDALDGDGGCLDQLSSDGGRFAVIGGIWDVDVLDNGTTTPANVIFPAACDDLGLGMPPESDGGFNFAAPDGGVLTIAAAVAAQSTAANIYGVVTAIKAWNPSSSAAESGTVYLQDPVASGATPAVHSGISVYISKTDAPTVGSNIPARGDVVELTNVTWSPYKGENQFAATSSTQLISLGTAPLPPPVTLPASQLGASTTNGYEGMRVTAEGAPFSAVGGACPSALEYTSSSGG